MTRLNVMSNLIMGFVATLAPLVVIWYGGLEVIDGRMSIGSLFAFNMYLAYLFNPLRSLYEFVVTFHGTLASMERIHRLRSVAEESADKPRQTRCARSTRAAVEFRNVSFSYGHDRLEVLNRLCLTAASDRTTAIVGHSGVGKTTIFNLLLNIYDGYEGEILLAGNDIRAISLNDLRKWIQLVPQDPVLLNRNVLENIAYGSPEAKEAEVIRAAEIALADEFIVRLPLGYKTVIGERGVTLSGGEKQRIALARAVLGNPKVLLLDEATAFLDSDTEAKVQQAIQNSTINRTCIVVAHRLNTVLKADQICVLAHGSVLACGSHSELYSSCGAYRNLVDKQFMLNRDLELPAFCS